VKQHIKARIAAALAQPQRGSASIELVLLFPVLLLAFVLIPAAYHGVNAKLTLDEAAAQAARDATLATTPGQATAAAQADINQDLASLGAACTDVAMNIVVGQLAPGSTVTVSLSCHTTAQALAGLSLGVGWPIHATASSPVDQYVGG
jgi:Flp pilus assembly protein TadG